MTAKIASQIPYTKHFKVFSRNIEFVGRVFHYYQNLGGNVQSPSPEYNALNQNPYFWNDFNHMALQSVIIVLGKIFDLDSRSYGLGKLVEALKNDLAHFSKSNLRKRKMETNGNAVWLDPFIVEAHELTIEDIVVIESQVNNANALWKTISPLRKKIYAHDDMLDDEQRNEIHAEVRHSDLKDLVRILINISNALWLAENNGDRPDFDVDYERPSRDAGAEIYKLLKILVDGTKLSSW